MRPALLVKEDHHLALARVEDLLRLVKEVVIRLHPGGAELKKIQGSKRLLVHRAESREGRNRVLREELLQEMLGRDEALIHLHPPCERGSRQLNILLRHRLCSISCCTGPGQTLVRVKATLSASRKAEGRA